MKLRLDQRNIKWGITAFVVILCSIIVFFTIYRYHSVQKFLDLCMSILAPFIYGLVMAYLLCPIYNFTVRNMYSFISKRTKKHTYDLTVSKALGSVVALVFLLVVVTGVLWMIIPGLFDSVVRIIEILPASMDSFMGWIDSKLVRFPDIKDVVDVWIRDFTDNVIKFATEKVLPEYSTIVISVSEGVIGVASAIMDVFIGLIICVYFLNSKDTFSAQIKKVIVAFFKDDTAEEILNGAAFTNKTFGGFINGKIIDSMIIGAICFLVMSLFGWEYSLLISCIIGITNIIPFFGPFIGAIPSALLLLMVEPKQCIYFIIFILILQQFDGNILGPKILGDSTGLASFWVLFAVLVGGGLFGFIGMVVSIPVFAVIYAYVSRAVNKKLEKKGFSTNISDYKVDSYRVKKPREKLFKKGGNDNGLETDKKQD